MFGFFNCNSKNIPELKYIETPIVAHCNLKCNFCGFFCNHINEEFFVDFNNYKEDIQMLSKKINIKQIRLIGGEPLLHPDINKFMIATREAYPNATVNVVTNAILLPQIEEKFWQTLKEYNIFLDISCYDIWNKDFSAVNNKIKKYNIENYVITNKPYFYEQLNLNGDSDIKKTFQKCKCKECINLWNHKLYPCHNAFRSFYNKRFNTNLELPPGIDIYKASGKEIYNKLIKNPKPFSACRFCLESGILHKWSRYEE